MLKKISGFIFQNYPYVFLIDAILSLIDSVTIYFFPKSFFSDMRDFVAYVVMFGAAPFFFSLFVVETKSKKPYFLLILTTILTSLGSTWNVIHLISNSSLFEVFALEVNMHGVVVEHPSYIVFDVFINLIQLTIGIYGLRALVQEVPQIKSFGIRYGLGTLGALTIVGFHLVLFILTIPLILIAGTGNFLSLDGKNVMSVERVYEKEGRKLHLIPMVHIGDEAFYKEISKVEGKVKTLFLLEGVKDEKELLKNLDYSKLASSAGLDLQQKHFRPTAPKERQKNITIIHADVDVNDFNPKTRAFLKETFDQINEKPFFEIMTMKNENISKEDISMLVVDLVDKRNEFVLKKLKDLEKNYKEIYIPWGAAHMPEIERRVLASGYKLISENERVIIPLNKVLEKISNSAKETRPEYVD